MFDSEEVVNLWFRCFVYKRMTIDDQSRPNSQHWRLLNMPRPPEELGVEFTLLSSATYLQVAVGSDWSLITAIQLTVLSGE